MSKIHLFGEIYFSRAYIIQSWVREDNHFRSHFDGRGWTTGKDNRLLGQKLQYSTQN